MRLRYALLVWLPIAVFGLSAPAHAVFEYTPFDPPPAGEDSHAQILDDIYGGTFLPNGADFSNGTVDALRVWDTNDGDITLHILNGDQNDVDQVWTDGIAMVTATAKFAALTQSFGWNQGLGPTGQDPIYTELLTEADVGGPGVDLMISGDFLWGIEPNGDEWWSKNDLNPDAASDHMLTYLIENVPGREGEQIWLLFWEDLPIGGPSGSSDIDFNDFVIEVAATAVTPEPSTFLLLGLGVGGLALLRRSRAAQPSRTRKKIA